MGKQTLVRGNDDQRQGLDEHDRAETHRAAEVATVGVDLATPFRKKAANVGIDGWQFLACQELKAASYFINFLCRPDIALRNMEENGM